MTVVVNGVVVVGWTSLSSEVWVRSSEWDPKRENVWEWHCCVQQWAQCHQQQQTTNILVLIPSEHSKTRIWILKTYLSTTSYKPWLNQKCDIVTGMQTGIPQWFRFIVVWLTPCDGFGYKPSCKLELWQHYSGLPCLHVDSRYHHDRLESASSHVKVSV